MDSVQDRGGNTVSETGTGDDSRTAVLHAVLVTIQLFDRGPRLSPDILQAPHGTGGCCVTKDAGIMKMETQEAFWHQLKQ